MSSFNQSIDESGYGNAALGGGGYGGAGFGSQWLWWVLILILIFLFFFNKKDGIDSGYGRGYGHDDGCCTVKGCRPAFFDESNYEEECHIKEKVDSQSEKTRTMIEHKWEIDQAEKFQKGLFENSELKNKIYQLETEKNLALQLAPIKEQLCRIPKGAECVVPTVTPCLCGCNPFNCNNEPRRCCD